MKAFYESIKIENKSVNIQRTQTKEIYHQNKDNEINKFVSSDYYIIHNKKNTEIKFRHNTNQIE